MDRSEAHCKHNIALDETLVLQTCCMCERRNVPVSALKQKWDVVKLNECFRVDRY